MQRNWSNAWKHDSQSGKILQTFGEKEITHAGICQLRAVLCPLSVAKKILIILYILSKYERFEKLAGLPILWFCQNFSEAELGITAIYSLNKDNGLLSICILASQESHFEVIYPVFGYRAHLNTLYGGQF